MILLREVAVDAALKSEFNVDEKPRNDRRERSRIILSNNDTVCFFYFFPLFQIVISPHVRGVWRCSG